MTKYSFHELLAVIVILGIIVAIAIPAVGSVMDRARSGGAEAESSLVEDAARLYVTVGDGAKEFGTSDTLTLNVDEDLIQGGYLEADVKPETQAGNVVVQRVKGDGGTAENPVYTYSYDFTSGTSAP